MTDEPLLICTCLRCQKTWEVSFDIVPCECEDDAEWLYRTVVVDDE